MPRESLLSLPFASPRFMASDYCAANAVRAERLWATLCPVRLIPGSEVWYIGFRPEWDGEARRWRLHEDLRDPCVVLEMPPRRGEMYRLESRGTGIPFLAPGWTLDYVQPYEEWREA